MARKLTNSLFFCYNENRGDRMNETIIMFTEEETAVDYKTGNKREKSAVIAEVRNKKQKEEIRSYDIKELVRNKQFVITYQNGEVLKIDIPKNDYYAVVLETILKRKKKIYDEVVYSIVGGFKETRDGNIETYSPWEAIVSEPGKEEKVVKAPITVIDCVKCMFQNDEIKSFRKKGTNTLEYEIITIEDEKVRILTAPANKAVPLLDDIYQAYKKKQTLNVVKEKLVPLAKTVLVLTTGALIVTSPYAQQNIKMVTSKVSEWNKEADDKAKIQNDLLLMSSYYTILKTDTLSNDEYNHFVALIRETMNYYEENNLTDSIDYEIILDYKALTDSKYQSIRNAH